MSNFLMIYINENTNFNHDTTTKAILSIDNTNLNSSINEHSEGFVTYKFNEEEININIAKEWKFIAIESSGKAALQFAIELNKLLDVNLCLADSSYSFLCQLDKICSIVELEDIIAKGVFVNQ